MSESAYTDRQATVSAFSDNYFLVHCDSQSDDVLLKLLDEDGDANAPFDDVISDMLGPISVGSSFRIASVARLFKQFGSSRIAELVLSFVRVSNTTKRKKRKH